MSIAGDTQLPETVIRADGCKFVPRKLFITMVIVILLVVTGYELVLFYHDKGVLCQVFPSDCTISALTNPVPSPSSSTSSQGTNQGYTLNQFQGKMSPQVRQCVLAKLGRAKALEEFNNFRATHTVDWETFAAFQSCVAP